MNALWSGLRRPASLWFLLLAMIVSLLMALVWLVGQYETNALEEKLELQAQQIVVDLRSGLTEQVQRLAGLQAQKPPKAWQMLAAQLLLQHPDAVRIEKRDNAGRLQAISMTPHQPQLNGLPTYTPFNGGMRGLHVQQLCAQAMRTAEPVYSNNYFVPLPEGLGLELVDVCMPSNPLGDQSSHVVVTLSLSTLLARHLGGQVLPHQEVILLEADGTRVATLAPPTAPKISNRQMYKAQALLDLSGNTLVLRLVSWQHSPALIPNVLTAAVLLLSVALGLIVVMLLRDFRRRMRLQKELSQALAFRKAMEDSLITGLLARDLQGRITYANPAFCTMVDYSAHELLQSDPKHPPYWPIEHALDYQKRWVERPMGEASAREGMESEFQRKDGQALAVLIIDSPLRDAAGAHTGWMSAVVDITLQRKAQALTRLSMDRLQQSAKLASLGEMASLISHEINQPLSAIASYAQGSLHVLQQWDGVDPLPRAQLQTEPSGKPPVARHELRAAIQAIAQQAARASVVIQSIQNWVKRNTQMREAVLPAHLISSIEPLLALLSKQMSLPVEIDLEAQLPMVSCDKTMIEQVLLNLVRNALEAAQTADAHEAVKIRVFLASKARLGKSARVQFEVLDVGAGLDTQLREKMGAPFFTTKPGGMGLGLSFCRTVMEQHGSQLQDRANTPQGTVFSFQLTAVTAVAAPKAD